MFSTEQNALSDSQFIMSYLTHPLRYSISQIADYVQEAPSLCCLKETRTGKYLLTNQFETELTGLKPDEFVGLTVDDLNCGFYIGSNEAFVNTIKELDKKADADKCPVFYREILLTHEGFIQSRNIIKCPVISQNIKDKVIAILTYEEDLTLRENPLELFKLYQKHYLPKQAIEQFLGYFKVNTCFREMPTNTETQVLMAMSHDPSHKEVAKLLNIKYRTVDHHSYVLGSKLKEHVQLAEVLRKIRGKWIPLPVR